MAICALKAIICTVKWELPSYASSVGGRKLGTLQMEVLAIGVCCSATFPRGPERCLRGGHGASSSGCCEIKGHPSEGDSSYGIAGVIHCCGIGGCIS
ncbi:hypothetical protein GW17_00021096 [Ensete ventricosum]|nr:hypothetical protein GW17_00021096 [Ensete ventricosum]